MATDIRLKETLPEITEAIVATYAIKRYVENTSRLFLGALTWLTAASVTKTKGSPMLKGLVRALIPKISPTNTPFRIPFSLFVDQSKKSRALLNKNTANRLVTSGCFVCHK